MKAKFVGKVAAAALSVVLAAARGGDRPVTVEDSISMLRISDPNPLLRQEAKWSPDGRHVAVITFQGDTAAGVNHYRLLLYGSADLRARLGATGGPLPEPTVLATFDSTSNREGVTKPRWLDADQIAFLAENPGETAPQAYVVDIRTGSRRQLTSWPGGVTEFDSRGGTTAFLVDLERIKPSQIADPASDTITIVDPSLIEVIWEGRRVYQLMIQRPGEAPVRAKLPPFTLSTDLLQRVTMAPDGTKAVVIGRPETIPAEWRRYSHGGYAPKIESLRGSDNPHLMMYYLVDLRTGDVRPLVDAPIAWAWRAPERVEVRWSKDSRRLVVSSIFQPLKPEPSVADTAAVLAELNLDNGAFTVIRPLHKTGDVREKGLMMDFGWGPGPDEMYSVQSMLDGRDVAVKFRRDASGWQPAGEVPASDIRGAGGLSLRIVQGLNTPPELAVRDSADGREAIVTRLNPQFQALKFAGANPVEWTDRHARKWHGVLVLPPSHQPGQRHPLVVQTHGASPTDFMMDGAFRTTDGAQALAGRGLAVLQLEDMPELVSRADEGEGYMAGYEAGIEMLDREGVIDPARVGLVGFSRTVYHVVYTLAFSQRQYGAAVIADGVKASFSSYVLFGSGTVMKPMRDLYETFNGGSPFDEGMTSWMKRSPLLNFGKMETPLRIEAIRTVLAEWEPFALQHMHARPVEMVYFPNGQHELIRPREIKVAVEGNVDWFDFWLQGHEDPAPVKIAQYTRWRKMKADWAAAKSAPTQKK